MLALNYLLGLTNYSRAITTEIQQQAQTQTDRVTDRDHKSIKLKP